MNIINALLAIISVIAVIFAYRCYRQYTKPKYYITLDEYKHFERQYRSLSPIPTCSLEQYISEEIGTRHWGIKQ